MLKYYVLLILKLSILISVNAQKSGLTNWEDLYADNFIRVQIRYYIPAQNTCQGTNGKKFRFYYRVIGSYRNYPYFLNWKLDYYDCNGILYFQTYALNIGSRQNPEDISNWMSIESLDYEFDASKIETLHYEAEVSNSGKYNSGKKPIKNSTPPLGINGIRKARIKEPFDLSVNGGNLGLGADWIWYQDSCGYNEIGRGKVIRIAIENKVKLFVRAESKSDKTECVSTIIDIDGNSLEPDKIEGEDKICQGSSATLTVKGGALGIGGKWVWYEGSCGNKRIGIGNSIIVNPIQNTTYFVRAEGNLNNTACVYKEIKVYERYVEPYSIINVSGRNEICEGSNFALSIIGGKLSAESQWVWYEGSCGFKKIGEGENLYVKATKTTTYFVKAEGVCLTDNCIEKTITVIPKPPELTVIETPDQVFKGKKITLNVPNWKITPKLNIGWYEGSCSNENLLGYGSYIVVRPKSNTTYYAKGIGKCGTTKCLSTTIYPIKKGTNSNLKLFRDMNLGFGLGAEYLSFIANTQRYSYVTRSYNNFPIQIIGVGFNGGLRFNPIYKNFFTLGILIGGAVGSTPYELETVYRTINEGDLFETYSYERFNYGIELAIGSKPIKLVGIFNGFLQKNNYNADLNTQNNTVEDIYFNDNLLWDNLGVGLRLGDYTKRKDGANLDVIYTFNRELKSGDIISRLTVPFGIHGLSISYNQNNSYAISVDLRMFKPEDKWMDFTLDNSNLQLSFRYNLTAFIFKK